MSGRVVSPHDPVRWGILGTGTIARRFAGDLANAPGARLVAVGSRDRARAEAFGQALGIPRRHGCYADLVTDPQVDVVYIATPASAHLGNMLLCLEAGQPVLCEKPFTVDAREAREVVTAARRARVFVMEAMWTRFLPAVAELRALLAAGAVGEIRYLMADLGTDTGPEPDARVASRELGGGALLQKGVYLVSLASMLLGRPDRIVSLADTGPTGVDEHSAVVLGYPDHRVAVLLTSIGTRTQREGVVVGSTGQIRIHAPVLCPSTLSVSVRPHRPRPGTGDKGAASGMAARLIRYGKSNRLLRSLRERYWSLGDRLVHGVRTRVIRAPVLGEGLHYQASEVMRCLRTGRLESEIMPLEESVQVMETLDLIREQWSTSVAADSRTSRVDRAI